MRYLYNPVSGELDDTTDKNFGKKDMKIKEYNEMMAYLTRREPTIKESKGAFDKFIKQGKDGFAPPKRDILDYVNQQQNMYDGVPLNEKNKKINAMAKGGVIKDPTFTKYNKGGTTKNKKNIKKPTVKFAMSETPEEEAEMMLSGEAVEFMKWLKKNKDKTYNDWLKDKKTFLSDEQKKDPKIIDLSPYLPSFEEELKRMEEQKERDKKKETLDEFIKRRSNEMRIAESDNAGIQRLLALKS